MDVIVNGEPRTLPEGTTVARVLAELDLEEVSVGFRPATADNHPRIERREDGVVVATGHWRNGILLAPLTAHRVAGLLAGVPA